MLGLCLGGMGWGVLSTSAQPARPQADGAANPTAVFIPHYWDARRRLDPVELPATRVIRLMVDDEYPPFHYANADGTLAGFSVDLARAACAELKVACTIQARRWDTLLASLQEGRGDVIAAAMRVTPQIRASFNVTAPYHRAPGRFLARKDEPLNEVIPETLGERSVAVVAQSAHHAFLRDEFPAAKLNAVSSVETALDLLRTRAVDFVFADALALAVWLNGEQSRDCCTFKGGPFLSRRYFGEGVGLIMRKEDVQLRRAFDQAFAKLAEKGVYGEIYLRYFPISLF